MNETTKKGLERLAKDLNAIHLEKKTWTVTGRAYTGRDGIAYSAGMSAPKTNAKAFGWTLASDLFTLDNAKAFAKAITTSPNGDDLAKALTDSAELVAKYNHDDRYNAFTAILAYATTAKAIKADKVAEIIANAKTAKVATAKTAKALDLSILGL
jgi:hypothetical protein